MLSEKEKEGMKGELCQVLHKIGALQFGTFKLASGMISPYYIDLRIVPSFPDAFAKICSLYTKMIEKEVGLDSFDRIAGIPVAGMPFASVVAFQFKKPFIFIRKDVKMHGREKKIEGVLMPGNRVLLIDDLVTTGTSLIEAAKAVRAEGGVISDVVVLVDREEGGKDNLAKEGMSLHYLLKASEAARKLHAIGVISNEQYKTILMQIKKK